MFVRNQLRVVALFVCTAMLANASLAWAGTLIPNEVARRNGMVRSWFSQVQMDPSRNQLESVTLHDDMLVALTSAGVVHAMDANTGKTLWAVRIGKPSHPSVGPAIDKKHVAIVNGSTLFVLNRADGSEVMHKQVSGAVSGGPALAGDYAYVPLFSGRVEGYAIENSKRAAWYYTSRGRIFQSVVTASESLVWSTDDSRLYVAASNTDGVRYRFDTGSPIVAPPTVRAPLVYAGSMAGYVYALHENTGQQRWRYAAGFAVRHSPVIIGNTLYVATEEPALHAIDIETGAAKWFTEGVTQFVAASENRIYGIDSFGGLVALDRESGAVQARAASRGVNTAVLNNQTDRLYIFSQDGLVQCFHEIGADEPYLHQDKPATDTDKPKKKPKSTEKKADEGPVDPFGAGADPFGDAGNDVGDDPFGDAGGSDAGDDPFGDAGDDPFGDAGDGGDDPFGDAGDAGDDPFAGGDDPFADG